MRAGLGEGNRGQMGGGFKIFFEVKSSISAPDTVASFEGGQDSFTQAASG